MIFCFLKDNDEPGRRNDGPSAEEYAAVRGREGRGMPSLQDLPQTEPHCKWPPATHASCVSKNKKNEDWIDNKRNKTLDFLWFQLQCQIVYEISRLVRNIERYYALENRRLASSSRLS